MNRFVLTLFFLVSLTLLAMVTVAAEELTMEKMHVRVAQGFVVIEGESRTLFVDYAQSVLHNYAKKNDRCRRFNFRQYEHDGFMAEQARVFGEMSLVEEGASSEEVNGMASYKVIYAPRVMRSKTVTLASTKQFGVTFSPKITEFTVTKDHEEYEKLQDIVQYNGALGEINPLIMQLDLTQLVPLLGGVPLRQIEKQGVIELFFSIKKESTLRNLLPEQCKGL